MENKFNILTEFIKDMSCETKNAQTYLHVKDVIKNYHLDFAIKAKPMKNKLIEVDTTLNFKDPRKLLAIFSSKIFNKKPNNLIKLEMLHRV